MTIVIVCLPSLQVKTILVVTPIAVMMVKSDRHKLDNLEDVIIGAAPVSSELESMMRRRFKGLKQTRQGLKNSHVQAVDFDCIYLAK